MTAAVLPLAEDAARSAWHVRSLGELITELRERHPDVPLAEVRRAARVALVLDPEDTDTEIARLRAGLRVAHGRIHDLERELAALRGRALDVWLGLETERHGDPGDETAEQSPHVETDP